MGFFLFFSHPLLLFSLLLPFVSCKSRVDKCLGFQISRKTVYFYQLHPVIIKYVSFKLPWFPVVILLLNKPYKVFPLEGKVYISMLYFSRRQERLEQWEGDEKGRVTLITLGMCCTNWEANNVHGWLLCSVPKASGSLTGCSLNV